MGWVSGTPVHLARKCGTRRSRSSDGVSRPSPPPITIDEALEGGYDSTLVSIDAAVVDQLRGSSRKDVMLQVGGKLFNATLDHGRIPPLDRGSIVRVTGVCSVAAENQTTTPTASDSRVLIRFVVGGSGVRSESKRCDYQSRGLSKISRIRSMPATPQNGAPNGHAAFTIATCSRNVYN